jgi:hypothetical protein
MSLTRIDRAGGAHGRPAPGCCARIRLHHQYLQREAIDSAIVAIEQSVLIDRDAKATALTEIVRLTKLRDQLEKRVRWELPEWQVQSKRFREPRRGAD